MTNPCFNCPDRSIWCHAECEKYKAFNEEREVVRKNAKLQADFMNYRAGKYIKKAQRMRGKLKRRR